MDEEVGLGYRAVNDNYKGINKKDKVIERDFALLLARWKSPIDEVVLSK